MKDLLQDIRQSLRSLGRRPGFTTIAVVTLALGLGANIAVFSVLEAVLLAPLPFPQPEGLVRLYQAYPERDFLRGTVSQLDAEDWDRQSRTLAHVGVYSTFASGLVLLSGEEPRAVTTAYVSPGFFAALGTPPLLGRPLQPRDAEAGERAVVVSYGFWRRELGGDPAAAGRALTFDGEPYTVVGVMPEGFRFPRSEVEVWAPLEVIPEASIPRHRFVRWLHTVGRLAPGAGVGEAQAELSGIAHRLARQHPDSNEGAEAVTVVPLREDLVGEVRPALLTLFAAVALVLLIACANVTNLLLARGVGRRRELAIRAALGAGRWRIVRQLLMESALASLLGGGLGLLVAVWGVDLLVRLEGIGLPRAAEVRFDAPVFFFALAAAAVTALLSGLAPALRLSRQQVGGGFRTAGSGAGEGGAQALLRRVLVAAEVALAALLLIGAALVVRSLVNMVRVDPGFEPSRLLAVSLTVPDYKYPEQEDYSRIYRESMERIAALPGVESVASIKSLPLRDSRESFSFTVVGRPLPDFAERPAAELYPASPNLFRTLGVPVTAGRSLSPLDGEDSPLVAVINETAARRFWAGEDPVGQRIQVGEQEIEVVGVVADVRHKDLVNPPNPAFYFPQEQISRRVFTLLVRTAGAPLALAAPVRDAIWDLDPQQPITRVASMEEVVASSLAPSRFFTLLLGLFAALALALAALGVYGVVSFTVNQRTREIGIRMAVGADRASVLRLVVRQGMGMVLLGIGVGVLPALGLTRLLGGHLFQVSPTDPLAFGAVPVALALVAVVACYLPGRRAAGIDPVEAVHQEL